MTRFGVSTHLYHGERLGPSHLETIAAHGFDLIEIFATKTHFDYRDPARVREMRDWLKAAGLDAGTMHAPISDGLVGGVWGRPYSNASIDQPTRKEAIGETRTALDAARELGCRAIVVHLGIPRGQKTAAGDNDASAVRRSVETLAEAASDRGVRLALEVIPNGLSTPEALVDLLEGDLDLGSAGICLDFGHAHMLSSAPEAIEALGGHIITTHVHDNNGRDDDHLVPFAGTIDWPAALMAMFKVGYGGHWVFEVADRGDAADVLRRTVGARARLQAILEDLAQPFVFEE